MRHVREVIGNWRWRFKALASAHRDEPRDEPDCRCASTLLRVKTARNDSLMYGEQCLSCGVLVGTWVKRDTIDDPDEIEPWDEGLQVDWFQRRSMLSQERRRTRHREEWFKLYDEYLGSPEWKRRRNHVIARADGNCEGCREQRVAHVHHLTYDRVGAEMLWDLVGVCQPCHERIHGKGAA